jgi:hypothetical protein
MKKSILLLISLVAALALSAQVQTVVTGKVNNKPDKPVFLLVYFFDTTSMKEQEVPLQARIGEDNTFTFTTDLIKRPFTTCRIGFNNEGQKIIVSPGDSLVTEFTCGAMDSTMSFTRGNAGINGYLKAYQLAFSKRPEEMLFRTNPDSTLVFYETDLRDLKLAMLHRIDSMGQLDPAFVSLETIRINCDYFNSLMGRDVMEALGDTVRNSLVKPLLQLIPLSDDQVFLDLREYREFIWRYIGHSLEIPAGRNLVMQDYLDKADTELSGLSNVWYNFDLITDRIRQTHNTRDKAMIRDYFIRHSYDQRLTKLLASADLGRSDRNYRDASRIMLSAFSYFLAILFIGVLFLALTFLFNYLKKKGIVTNPLAVLLWGIGIFGLFVGALYLKQDVYPGHRLVPVVRLATVGGFALFNIFFLIPVWFRKDRFNVFGIILLVVSAAYALFLYKLGDVSFRISPRAAWLQHHSIVFIVNSWLIIMLGSFFMHYLILLVRKGQDIGYLFRERLVSIEVLVNILFVAALFSRTLTFHFRQDADQNALLIFIAGTAIFYLHALWFIPRYLMGMRIGRYLAGTGILLLVTFIGFYLENRIGVYASLRSIGIRLDLFDVLRLPDAFLVKTVLALQLFIVPAFIYAYVKVQLKEKNIGFKLFRNKEAELNQLRSQVNPHFLFNSLNTLYAFALKENSAKTAEYIAKLANLMRYLVDDMEKERIPVQKEISYIRDYINLQAIRCPVEQNIEIGSEIADDLPVMIAPMLMIPFVENAFKHGINPNKVSELKVHFRIDSNRFQFVIENSVDHDFQAFYKEKGFGIGIENVRQRLQHIYPGRHTLSVADTGGRFIVILTVEDLYHPEMSPV